MPSTAERFEKFHAENPIVYDTLERLVRHWVFSHGLQKLGIRMLWENARWEIIEATKNVDYKLNDHFTSYYVRLLMINNEDWVKLFEIRDSPANEWALAVIDARQRGSQ